MTVAFVVANAFGTVAWTSAYPTFTELFPTHLPGTGVSASVAVARAGGPEAARQPLETLTACRAAAAAA